MKNTVMKYVKMMYGVNIIKGGKTMMKGIVCIIDIFLAITTGFCVVGNLITQNFGEAWLWFIPVVVLLFNILSLKEE